MVVATEYWYSIFIALLVIIICYNIWHYTKLKRCGIPGPKPIPFIGHALHQIITGIGESEELWKKQYGNIFGIYIGRQPQITVADLDILKNVLVKDFHNFVDRVPPPVSSAYMLKMLLFKESDDWRRTRNIMSPTFSGGKLKLVRIATKTKLLRWSAIAYQTLDAVNICLGVYVMCSDIRRCADTLTTNIVKHADRGESFCVKEVFGSFTMDVIACTAFGIQVDSQKDPNDPFVKHANELFSPPSARMKLYGLFSVFFPQLRSVMIGRLGNVFLSNSAHFFKRTGEDLLEHLKDDAVTKSGFMKLLLDAKLDGTTLGFSKPVKESMKRMLRRDVLWAQGRKEFYLPTIINLKNATSRFSAAWRHAILFKQMFSKKNFLVWSADLTTDEITAQGVLFFIAGYDSTASLLSYTSYLLATHPDIDQKLHDEIETVLGYGDVTYQSVAQLKYMEQVLLESLRMYPSFSRISRKASEEISYNGMIIPKGVGIIIPIYRIHHDPENFPYPEKFDPDRFSSENKNKIHPNAFLAFGCGPRLCLGMRLALVEAKIALAQVLRQVKFITTSETDIPLKVTTSGLTRPVRPIKLGVVTRP